MQIARRSLLFGLVANAWAQSQATFSTDVNVVSVLATVHDKDGHVIRNLTADDFVLSEDGTVQKIRYFSRETSLPVTIGLLVDTSRSQTGVLEQERRASQVFLNRVLRPDQDKGFIAHFDERVEVVQGLTSSREDLASALQRLQIPGHYATLIYSAVRNCSEQVMREQSGRKAFILLTDGVAFHDDTTIGTAIEFAQRSDTILYSIRFADPIKAYRPVRAAVLSAASNQGKEGLHRMAQETGGESYEVSKKLTLDVIYSQIEETLRSQYSIGYMPERIGTRSDSGYHKIRLTAKDRNLVVNARQGYYSK